MSSAPHSGLPKDFRKIFYCRILLLDTSLVASESSSTKYTRPSQNHDYKDEERASAPGTQGYCNRTRKAAAEYLGPQQAPLQLCFLRPGLSAACCRSRTYSTQYILVVFVDTDYEN